jgi:hypothetical protein
MNEKIRVVVAKPGLDDPLGFNQLFRLNRSAAEPQPKRIHRRDAENSEFCSSTNSRCSR